MFFQHHFVAVAAEGGLNPDDFEAGLQIQYQHGDVGAVAFGLQITIPLTLNPLVLLFHQGLGNTFGALGTLHASQPAVKGIDIFLVAELETAGLFVAVVGHHQLDIELVGNALIDFMRICISKNLLRKSVEIFPSFAGKRGFFADDLHTPIVPCSHTFG